MNTPSRQSLGWMACLVGAGAFTVLAAGPLEAAHFGGGGHMGGGGHVGGGGHFSGGMHSGGGRSYSGHAVGGRSHSGYSGRVYSGRAYSGRAYGGRVYGGSRAYGGRSYTARGYTTVGPRGAHRNWGWGGRYGWGHYGYRHWWGPSWWGGYPFYWYWWGYYPFSWWWWGGPWWGPSVYLYYGDGYGSGYGYTGPYGLTSQFGTVKTDVEPDEAEVWLEGKYVGTADDFDGYPDFLYLKPAKYHIEFRLKGYETYAVDLDVSRGDFAKIDHNLQRLPGTPKLQEFPPSKGVPYGRFFDKNGPVNPEQLAPRRHYRTEAREDQEQGQEEEQAPPKGREEMGIDDRSGEEQEQAPPPPRHILAHRARLHLKVTPPDAAVYIDDEYAGAAEDLAASPRGYITDPGKHTITVTRPGYKSKTVDVEAKAGSAVDVVVELEK